MSTTAPETEAPTQPPTEKRVLIMGLDDAGKTSLLYKVRLGEVAYTIPTRGFNVETIKHKEDVKFTMWDLGGRPACRPDWASYYQGKHAVVFVVDAADRSRIEEAARELRTILESEELRSCPLLVFAHKQDKADCMSLDEIRAALNFGQVTPNAKHILGSSVISGVGIYEGLEWLRVTLYDLPPSTNA